MDGQDWHIVCCMAVGIGSPSQPEDEEKVSAGGLINTLQRVHPALSHGVNLGCFGRCKGFVKPENSAVAAVFLCSLHSESRLKATALGLT